MELLVDRVGFQNCGFPNLCFDILLRNTRIQLEIGNAYARTYFTRPIETYWRGKTRHARRIRGDLTMGTTDTGVGMMCYISILLINY
jgi:hypothetical protein